ncbi:MAG: signal transduction histidine kinase/CheY-like chemotaxis protein [bacterium]
MSRNTSGNHPEVDDQSLLIAELYLANKKLTLQAIENDRQMDELILANKKLTLQAIEIDKRAGELLLANEEKDKRAGELVLANEEEDKRAEDLVLANLEKIKRADELVLANREKDRRADSLVTVQTELALQQSETRKLTEELFLADIRKDRQARQLADAVYEKDKRIDELVEANDERHRQADELLLLGVEHNRRVGDLKNANRKLLLRTEQLVRAQKMEALGRLTGGIAHDFNNLLAVIHWNVELFELNDQSGTEHEELAAIKMAVRSGAEMTKRLLTSSRKTVLRSQPTDIAALIASKEKVFTHLLGTPVTVTYDLDPTSWPALVDANRFEDAVYNLVTNAQQAMPNGGDLCIATENVIIDEDTAQYFGDVSAGEFLLVSVRDTGHGIEPHLLDTVFDPFFTSKKIGDSHGLGLSMVYGFAKQSNGHVLIESEPDVSTVVKLYLPRATESVRSAPQADLKDTSLLQIVGARILVVEDNPEILKICKTVLEMQGFDVVTSMNGRDALARLSDGTPFDLLFSDIDLIGDMSGIDVQREAHLLHPKIKSVLTTGYGSADELGSQTPIEFTEILHKPYSRKELLERLRDALAQ